MANSNRRPAMPVLPRAPTPEEVLPDRFQAPCPCGGQVKTRRQLTRFEWTEPVRPCTRRGCSYKLDAGEFHLRSWNPKTNSAEWRGQCPNCKGTGQVGGPQRKVCGRIVSREVCDVCAGKAQHALPGDLQVQVPDDPQMRYARELGLVAPVKGEAAPAPAPAEQPAAPVAAMAEEAQ